MNVKRRIIILDTTLRDGDQSPGFAFSRRDKIRIATQLEMLGVDIIEGGFPSSSRGQFEDMKELASVIESAYLSAMTRAIPADIVKTAKAIDKVKRNIIHTSIPTSPIHRERKLNKTKSEIISMAVEAVKCAKIHADLVEIGAEDATRTEPEFLSEFCAAVIDAGADIVNISDTVGYAQPAEYANLIRSIMRSNVAFIDGSVRLSVHCHNDLGLATANTLAGIEAGATQAEVTLLGIGERAGNAPLEEVVCAMRTRPTYYTGVFTGIKNENLVKASSVLARICGTALPVNKPIVGSNVFVHGSGIHQQGIVNCERTYSILVPESVGRISNHIAFSRHSGTEGLKAKVKQLTGKDISNQDAALLFELCKEAADEKKILSSTDILKIFNGQSFVEGPVYSVAKVRHREAEDGLFCVTVDVKDECGRIIKCKASAAGLFDAVKSAICDELSVQISSFEVSHTIAANARESNGRMTVFAFSGFDEYLEESFGSESTYMFAECVAGICNQILCKKRFSSMQHFTQRQA